jgi:Tfp pilus assembly protein PilO
MKYLLPLINLVLAAGLFFVVTDKMFVNAALDEKSEQVSESTGGIRALKKRQQELDDAIVKAKALGKRVDELNGQYNSFSPSDIEKLDMLLPDHVNNIQLIIDVNGIAKRNSMSIKNIKVATSEDKETSSSERKQSSLNANLGTMLLSFSVTGPYEAYKKFLSDLSSSLRIIDISSTSFNTEDKGIYNYNIELRTYWLK